MKKLKEIFQNYPIICNSVLIAFVLALLVMVAYYAMDFGTRHDSRCEVPNFKGLFLEDVNSFAEENDLEIAISDSLYIPSHPGGVVLDQHPAEGAVVKPGRKIYVTISSLKQRQVVVPFAAKRTLRQALHLLETAGFTIEKLQYVRDMATNYVLAEFVNGKEIVEGSTLQANVGSGVVLRVGYAEKETAPSVPNLSGLTLAEAQHKLWDAGLNVGDVAFDQGILAVERKNAKVYYQSVRPKSGVWFGEKVSIKLSLTKKSEITEAPEAKAEEKAEETKPVEEKKVEEPKPEEKKAEEPKPAPKAEPKPESEAPAAEPAAPAAESQAVAVDDTQEFF